MKIIFLASAESIHSVRWIKYFSFREDIEIIWISTKEPGKETIDEIANIKKEISIYTFNNIKMCRKIFKKLLSLEKSIVHIHYLGWHSLLLLLINKNNKIIATPWGSDLLLNRNFLKNLWLKYIFRKTNCVITDSNRLGKISREFGVNKKNIHLCNFAIDTDLYKKKRTIFTNRDQILIGSNRRLEKIYDVKTFIKSSQIILENFKNIKFIIAGDGSLKDELQQLINERKLTKNITLIGSLNTKQMIKFYNDIDIYISTSLSDGGLSSSVAEAMSFERLVIVADNSDNKKWIRNGLNGFLFKNKDELNLSEIIKINLNNQDASKKIAETGRKLIKNNFSYASEMGKVNLIYEKTLID